MRKRIAAAAAAGSLVAGGAIGAALFGPGSATAQTTTTQPPAAEGRPHGHHEMVDDLSVAAQAIGISQDDLTAALRSGQSLAQVARAHNVDPQKVIDALVADERSELDDAVKAGRITQAQADQKKAGVVQRITDRVNNAGGFKGRGRGPGGGHHAEKVDDLSVAAQAIGISQDDLTAALRSGQSLAQVARAHNVDPQKVIDSLVADERSELDDAVKAGRITQAQADQKKAGVVQRITDRVNNAGRPRG